ncbi:Gfo/Idh/MocA family protein [Paenibacillus sp. PDC88]|uniref:Gfo/Idh/MocA family protein n=1 Tax=Paenibacillus sp. PDC88 TaxID=1884375 RepID=UPI00089984B7|nr:Gfo/Idh/MocA family oxidoreductase [Paenibacillus sp. PDC88]SDW07054.1 Predicted dehydrogenase [Paenibacillus sp. PDC88]
MRKLRIGMISFAHSHAFSYYRQLQLIENAEVTAIADLHYDRVKAIVERDHVQFYQDHLELLELPDIDAVIICSENRHHAALVTDSAKAGKHILCEKPLGTGRVEMRQMIDICHELQVQLMTAFPCRYLPSVIRVKEAVAQGEIGEVMAVKGYNRGGMPGGWFVDPAQSGGGALLDHTVHVADLLNWMLGVQPRVVHAEKGTLFHDITVEDSGIVHLEYDNGVIGVIDTSWSRNPVFPYWGDVKLDIIGTEGIIRMDAFAQVNEVFSIEQGRARYSYFGDKMDYYMLQDFVNRILDGRPVAITGEDGYAAAEVALSAYDYLKRRT